MKVVKTPKVDWRKMEGGTIAVKKINAYLSYTFLSNYDVPPDLCLREAEEILSLPMNRIHIAKYLLDRYGTYYLFPGDLQCYEGPPRALKIANNVNLYWTAAGRVLKYLQYL